MKPRPLGSKFCEDFKSYGVCLSPPAHILSPIGTNGKSLAAISKFPSAMGELMIGKTLATNEDEITSAMIGNDELENY